ncbi:hypothetical protein [Kiloniella sp.]|uniref:hypothetical protein n=1 Tax=Kiloniella sp. TaxID=1938587 RepID=UPI003A932D2B
MERSQLDLHRFEKVLALLDSAVEGEVLAALGRAKHMLAGADISFRELKVGISSSQGSAQEPVQGGDPTQVQRLEQELESLRWSLARHELQVAALRQSVEEKSVTIQSEQAKRHAQEGELMGLRQAHAVQMEEALNRKEEVEKLTKQLAQYQAFEKETGVGPRVSLRQRMKATADAPQHPEQVRSSRADRRKGGTRSDDAVRLRSSKVASDAVEQAAFQFIGGKDRSVGKEYRWARLEDRHQVMAVVTEVGNDEAELNALERAMGLLAEA